MVTSEYNLHTGYYCDLALLEDTALCCKLVSGEDDALTVLFQRYKTLVFAIANRVLHNEGEAEEVVQQVFLEVYQNILQLDLAKGSFRTWLLQYAYHRSFNRKKYLISNRFYVWQEWDQSFDKAEEYDHRLQLCRSEIRLLVQELLSTLSGFQQRVMELSYIRGLTAEEIAKEIGVSVCIVRHSVQSGKVRLRSVLLGRRAAKELTSDRPGGQLLKARHAATATNE